MWKQAKNRPIKFIDLAMYLLDTIDDSRMSKLRTSYIHNIGQVERGRTKWERKTVLAEGDPLCTESNKTIDPVFFVQMYRSGTDCG